MVVKHLSSVEWMQSLQDWLAVQTLGSLLVSKTAKPVAPLANGACKPELSGHHGQSRPSYMPRAL